MPLQLCLVTTGGKRLKLRRCRTSRVKRRSLPELAQFSAQGTGAGEAKTERPNDLPRAPEPEARTHLQGKYGSYCSEGTLEVDAYLSPASSSLTLPYSKMLSVNGPGFSCSNTFRKVEVCCRGLEARRSTGRGSQCSCCFSWQGKKCSDVHEAAIFLLFCCCLAKVKCVLRVKGTAVWPMPWAHTDSLGSLPPSWPKKLMVAGVLMPFPTAANVLRPVKEVEDFLNQPPCWADWEGL